MARYGRYWVDWPTAAGAMMFVLVGGGFAVFGGWQLLTTYSFLQNASEAQAIVIDSNESCDSDGCTYWPDFSLTDPAGQERILPTQFGSSAYGYGAGSEVTVKFNQDYDYVRVTGTSNLWLLGGAFFALGFPVCLLGFWLLFRHTVWHDTEVE